MTLGNLQHSCMSVKQDASRMFEMTTANAITASMDG